jgi:hypothetical protein
MSLRTRRLYQLRGALANENLDCVRTTLRDNLRHPFRARTFVVSLEAPCRE